MVLRGSSHVLLMGSPTGVGVGFALQTWPTLVNNMAIHKFFLQCH